MTSTPETTFTEDAALDEDVFDTQPLPALAGWVSADSGPSGLDTDSSYVPALAPSAAPAFSSRQASYGASSAQARTAPIPVRVALAVGAVVVLTVAPIGGWLLLRPGTQRRPPRKATPCPGPTRRA
jgi:hypothetical protein